MAAGTVLAQGRAGRCSFGGTLFPVYRWSIQAPRNRVTGDPLGNTASTNYADGMVTTRFTASMMTGRGSGGAMDPSTGILAKFITRAIATDSGMDDTTGITIAAGDGNSLWTIANAKPESFSVRFAKGAPVGFDVVFVAPGIPTRSDDRATALSGVYSRHVTDGFRLLMYNHITFEIASGPAGSFAQYNGIYGMEINYSNNHIVNAPLDGTQNAQSYDAGNMRGGADITLRAYSGVGADPQPIGDGYAIKAVIGLDTPTNILLPVVVTNTDYDADVQPGAAFRVWRTMLLAKVTGGNYYQPVCHGTNGIVSLS